MKIKSSATISKETRHNSMPSNRKFGIFMSCVMIAVAIYFYLVSAHIGLIITLTLSAVTAFIVRFHPNLLGPLNWMWYRVGVILGALTSPIVLGMLFFLLITPTAIITRALGRDSLRLKRKDIKSYWIARQSGALTKDSFKDQF